MKYSLTEIAKITGGKVFGDETKTVQHIIVDSRLFSALEDAMFVAIKGDRNDGHRYLNELKSKQINRFLVSELPIDWETMNSHFVVVKDTLKALQKLAAYHRSKFSHEVIGITGSNGKTIVKEWIYQVLKNDFSILRSPKSYNSQVGVPLSVLLLEENHNLAIFEAGISKEGEMMNLKKIINPTIGIFTTIGDAHQENFPDLKRKVEEKLKLFVDTQTIIYNKDYQLIDLMLQSSHFFEDKKLLSWSKKFPADLMVERIAKKNQKSTLNLNFDGKKFQLIIPFVDDASIENVMNVCLLMLHLGYNASDIQQRISQLFPIAMRLEMKQAINRSVLINDFYNSDINSLAIALDFMMQQTNYDKKTLILSDILQSGKSEYVLYQEIAKLLELKKVNRLIAIGSTISKFADFFNVEKYFFNTTDDFIERLQQFSFNDEVILLKGARSFAFERISELLQQKSHQTVLQINLSKIIHNLNFFKSLLKPETKIMAMVKAFSYGAGNAEIAMLLQYHKVDYLGVAFADEGIMLRKAGVYLPIVVLNPEPTAFDQMIEYNLEPEIYSFETLDLFYHKLLAQRINSYPIHLKLNTGMNRLGFNADEINDLANQLSNQKEIIIRSVFSHLAAADDESYDDFTLSQLKQFDQMSRTIQKVSKTPVIRHILNTHGILRFSDYQFDMVRLGIGLYGVASIQQDKLQFASKLKTVVSQIKEVSPPDTVGYGRKGVLTRKSRIAVIPIGYAHGFNRQLGNGVGSVIIKGYEVPTVGNINMDMATVDITDFPDIKVGDEVIIFDENRPVEILAKKLNTISYEILTSISSRVQRIYIQE
jgi:alanine racemase